MAWSLTLVNGAMNSAASSNKTVTEMANFHRLIVADKLVEPPEGLTAAQLNQFYLDAVKDELIRYMKQEARRNLLIEKKKQANLEVQADLETQL